VKDIKTKSAVERQLQIITEAAYRLGDEADTVCPGPDWKGFMGMGNLLRHAYHRIDDAIVWNTVKVELPALRKGDYEHTCCRAIFSLAYFHASM
jgi:uncharacterized protein with HEPN domain